MNKAAPKTSCFLSSIFFSSWEILFILQRMQRWAPATTQTPSIDVFPWREQLASFMKTVRHWSFSLELRETRLKSLINFQCFTCHFIFHMMREYSDLAGGCFRNTRKRLIGKPAETTQAFDAVNSNLLSQSLFIPCWPKLMVFAPQALFFLP